MGADNFPKGISQKVNVIAGLEFELTYYNVPVLRVSHFCYEDSLPQNVLVFDININTNKIGNPSSSPGWDCLHFSRDLSVRPESTYSSHLVWVNIRADWVL